MLKGYDVSVWQTNVDWTKVRADFIIAKATEGVSVRDKLFDAHVVGALRQGIPWGGYHFARPTANKPEDEAAHFVQVCGAGQVAPCLDVETYGTTSPLTVMGADALAQWCDRWAIAVRDALGQYPLFYSFRSYMTQVAPRLSGPWAGLWVASASDDPTGPYLGRNYGQLTVVVEQYGQPSGEPGFPSAVDGNVAVPALLGGDVPLTNDEIKAVAKAVWDAAIPNLVDSSNPSAYTMLGGAHLEAWKAARSGEAIAVKLDGTADAIATAVVAKLGGSADVAAIKQAVKDALREGSG